ncbi:MAG: hypothetical protein QHG98_05665 [Methanothrix sp.]|jgi:hypothetical protein|uniref:hypothetical protein n=1 Tax=Methanothrix sp. TaxID=90426 RepID=UPI00247C1E02|nr:hypothetical protein [Methanothrix sp.]
MSAAVFLRVLLVLAIIASAALGSPGNSYHEEYTNVLRVAGTGLIDITTSAVDRRSGLEYYNVMYGEGDFEMDSTHEIATAPSGRSAPTNLTDTTHMTYLGSVPLVGVKVIKSRSIYGGIGAEIQESFAVTEMDRIQRTFFGSRSPCDSIAMDVSASFNGTWTTDAAWHKIFEKKVRDHTSFQGRFDVKKLLKIQEGSHPQNRFSGIDF